MGRKGSAPCGLRVDAETSGFSVLLDSKALFFYDFVLVNARELFPRRLPEAAKIGCPEKGELGENEAYGLGG